MNSSSSSETTRLISPPVPDRECINRELSLICSSDSFKGSKRSQEFLAFVVQYWIDGNVDPLKERTIGISLYKRPTDYGTAEDPVVRVRAGEVRRRLQRYYQAPPPESRVHIILPVGSYVPEFHWIEAASLAHEEQNLETSTEEVEEEVEQTASDEDNGCLSQPPLEQQLETLPRNRASFRTALLAGTVAVALLLTAFIWLRHSRSQDAVLRQFWAPAFETPKPLLICLPKPILFRPSNELYIRTAATPGEFDNETARMNSAPHLSPDDILHWKELTNNPDFGLSKGDVLASFRMANLLAKQGKSTELKIGSDYGWDDLRQSPAVLIGAFDNRAAMQITANLHFSFVEGELGRFRIQEKGQPERFWHPEFGSGSSKAGADYGLVTRLVNSSTGQFVVSVAGILSAGSGAASEVVTNEALLKRAVSRVPSDWKNKNLQIVVKTSVVDNVAGPPEIVAVYVW